MKVLVVPTIRENCILKFLEDWREIETWDEIVVVEDNPEKSFHLDLEHHYSWFEIDKELGENSWIISRRDSAIRSFGLWKAYEMGADYIFTLDDDCYPIRNSSFNQKHIDNIENTPKWTFSIPNMRTRGVPYDNLGVLKNVAMSVGLWEGIPDLDSIQSFNVENYINFKLPNFTRVMPQGQYFPLCGMNFCFKREATPLCYFPLMGKDQPFKRFDDIWFGIICKKICDHLNWHITMGEPFIYHSKASDKFTNLQREAPGIAANETFWEMIEKVNLESSTPVECMTEIASQLTKEEGYFGNLGRAIETWASLFKK